MTGCVWLETRQNSPVYFYKLELYFKGVLQLTMLCLQAQIDVCIAAAAGADEMP